MNIFIVGPMGSGKSTVGKIISDEMFLNFFDTDEEIESRTGASIDWIFDLEGEEGFRKRESEILNEMVEKNSIGHTPYFSKIKLNKKVKSNEIIQTHIVDMNSEGLIGNICQDHVKQ